MKKANPKSLRVGLHQPWTTSISTLNYNKTLLLQLRIQFWLFSVLRFLTAKMSNNTMTVVSQSSLNNRLHLFFFIKGVLFFFKKPKRTHFFRLFYKKRKYFVNRLFVKRFFLLLESFFIDTKKHSIFFLFKNLYSTFFLNKFLKFFELKKRVFSKRLKKTRRFFILFSYMLLAFFYKDANLLLQVLLLIFSKTKKHRNSFFSITKLFNMLLKYFPKVQNVCIKISGRINGRPRTQDRWLIFGSKLNLQTFDKKVNFAYDRAVTPSGVLGIKIWVQ